MLISDSSYFLHHFRDRDVMRTEIFRNAISLRYRTAVYELPHCAWATISQSSSCYIKSFMKNDKLKATTVRFTGSDLYLIECLQEKLGLGMVHIIRLAIRRLAESENLLPSKSAVGRR